MMDKRIWVISLLLCYFTVRSYAHIGCCVDHFPACSEWARQGYCHVNQLYMAQNCPRACDICVDENIVDRDYRCAAWAMYGGCGTFRAIYRCPHTCGRCAVPERKITAAKSIIMPDFACGGPTYRQIPEVLASNGHISGRTRTSLLGDSGSSSLDVTCGAAPISPYHLLTAAHCVTNTPYTLRSIQLRSSDLTRPETAKYDIMEIVYHPDYNPNSYERYNDIAIIITTQAMQFSDRVYPFCVSANQPPHNTPVTVQGYGYVNETTRASNLQEAKLFIVGQTECERAYEREGSLSHLQLSYPSLLQRSDVICAAAPNRDACQGDSGGPLFRQDNEGRRFLVGIVSSGKECGSILPGTYISVASHINFIDSILYGQRN